MTADGEACAPRPPTLRYARLEGLGRVGTVVATSLNLTMGLLVVLLKVLVQH